MKGGKIKKIIDNTRIEEEEKSNLTKREREREKKRRKKKKKEKTHTQTDTQKHQTLSEDQKLDRQTDKQIKRKTEP